MSVFFNMLGIRIESYEHVLGPPRVSFDSERIIFSVFKPFFKGSVPRGLAPQDRELTPLAPHAPGA